MTTPARPVAPRPAFLAACAAAVVLFAFVFNRLCGFRFYGYELAAGVIDGGYRVFLGQELFRDFFCPFGPVLFWAVGTFFKWFGVAYASYVALGSVMNAAVAGMVFWTAWCHGRDLGLAVAAALITAVWYMPVCAGGPIFTSGAFFFVFIAACLLLGPGPDPATGPGSMRTVLAGLALGLAFSVKSPVGMCGAFFLGLQVRCVGSGRDVVRLAGGFVLALAALALAIKPGAWGNAWRYFFLLPAFERGLEQFLSAGIAGWLCVVGFSLAVLLLKGERTLLACAAGLLLGCMLGGHQVRSGKSVHVFLPLLGLAFIGQPRGRAMLLALTLTEFSVPFLCCFFSQTVPFFGVQFFLVFQGWKRWCSDPDNARWAETLAGRSRLGREAPVWTGFSFLVLLGLRQIGMMRWNCFWLVPVVDPFVGLAALWLGLRLLSRRRILPGLSPMQGAILSLGCVLAGLTLVVRGASSALLFDKDAARFEDWAEKSVEQPVAGEFFLGLKLPSEEARELTSFHGYLSSLPPQARPFFIYQEENATPIYAAMGQGSPQPFLSFDPPFTNKGPEDFAKVCEGLKRAGVGTVALDAGGELPRDDETSACLRDWLRKDFILDRRIDDKVFFRRSTGCGGSGPRCP
ncbi:MAG: hypothetical protein HY927_08605 [Elusimicrobia bacterium]|nr:hypothetical protein [Elusimicrobiota bacterium]